MGKLEFKPVARTQFWEKDTFYLHCLTFTSPWGFPGGSDSKESACNTGDPGSIPRSGRSPGEGNDNPLQYSWRTSWTEDTVHGVTRSQTQLSDLTLPLSPCAWQVCSLCGLHRWHSGKESACQCKRRRFDPCVRKIHWNRKWQTTPVFLSGKFHGQRSLVSYSPWGCKESDTTVLLSPHTHMHSYFKGNSWRVCSGASTWKIQLFFIVLKKNASEYCRIKVSDVTVRSEC